MNRNLLALLVVVAIGATAACGDLDQQDATTPVVVDETEAPASTPTPTPLRPTETPPGVAPTEAPARTNTAIPPATSTPVRPNAIPFEFGAIATGGNAYRVDRLTLVIPAGHEFRMVIPINDPPGPEDLLVLLDLDTDAVLRIGVQSGTEDGRDVNDPAVASAFDEIMASVIVED